MIEIKNKMGSDVSISFDGSSEIIPNNVKIDITTLSCCQSKQGIARMIALIQSGSFEIYKDGINKGVGGFILMTSYYNTLFNTI